MLSEGMINYIGFGGTLSLLLTLLINGSPYTCFIILLCIIIIIEIIRLPQKKVGKFLTKDNQNCNEEPSLLNVAHKLGSVHSYDHIDKALYKAKSCGFDAVQFDVDFTGDHVPLVLRHRALDRVQLAALGAEPFARFARRHGVHRTRPCQVIGSVVDSNIQAPNPTTSTTSSNSNSDECSDVSEYLSSSEINMIDEAISSQAPLPKKDGRFMLLYDLVQICIKLKLKMFIDIKEPKRIEKKIRMFNRLFDTFPQLYKITVVTSIYPHIPYFIKRSNHNIMTGLTYRNNCLSNDQSGKKRDLNSIYRLTYSVLDELLKWCHRYIFWYFCQNQVYLMHHAETSSFSLNEMKNRGIEVLTWTVNSKTQQTYFREHLKCCFMTDVQPHESTLTNAELATILNNNQLRNVSAKNSLLGECKDNKLEDNSTPNIRKRISKKSIIDSTIVIKDEEEVAKEESLSSTSQTQSESKSNESKENLNSSIKTNELDMAAL